MTTMNAMGQMMVVSRYADPYWSNVIAMVPFANDAFGAVAFYDAVTKTARWGSGGGGMASAQSRFGDRSFRTGNSANCSLGSPGSEWVLSGDFSVECWFYVSLGAFIGAGWPGIISIPNTGGNISGGVLSNTAITGTYNGISVSVSDGAGDLRGRWNHYFFGRQSGTLYIILNGIGVNSITAASNISGTMSGNITHGTIGGTTPAGDNYFNDLRVTRGLCRYTAAFSRPTAPYPNQ